MQTFVLCYNIYDEVINLIIKKFSKQKNGMYKLLLEDDSNVVVHEEYILKNDLLLTKEIDKEDVNNIVKSEFYELLFTVNSKDFYRKSTAVLLAYNPYEIDEYAKKVGIVG